MIEFQGIDKTYEIEDRRIEALRDVSLDIRPGEVFGIIGHSGAGKSTLLRMINLIERPSSGRVRVNDRDVTDYRNERLRTLRRETGMIFQHFNLLSSKSVRANVAFPMKLAGGYSRGQIRERVDSLLERVGLAGQADKYPAQLSGGQKQRVGIARALACRPGILLCDEATSALDPQTTQSVLQLLADLNEELGITVVLVTHEMDAIRRICHRVAVMDDGAVVESGDTAEVFLHPRHPTSRRFVFEREHVDEDERRDDFHNVEGRIIKLTLRGEATYTPILGELARETGVDFSILSGRVDHIRNTPYGQLTLSMVGGDVDEALRRLDAEDVHVEVVRR
ncbi:Methionine import ATP-binding protein MetN [wastewater metagenome]|uniref:Methionine import ATP-binding protein MetN n=2 Tax=unclassified sequences TaxID=12908 RepID=A0A5B8RD02_9ZZZZ|nr:MULTISPECIES: methionine ABC transporter ATP-binding protein [Arhodomonas]MCS4505059.1 methionine ABC transporter ATP-binding protein [Arhodomonas aquaeolei]QEA06720.1 methionine import ATP-binding protein MetN [uncultured organism]